MERVDSSPVLHDATVFFAAIDNTLYALNCTSGEVKWKATFPGIGYQSPMLVDKLVYIRRNGQLLALDPGNGSVLHRYAFSGEGRAFSWNSKSLVVVAVTDTESNNDTGHGSVVCFDYNAAKPRWTTALGARLRKRLWPATRTTATLARDGFFYAIRMADGKIVWQIDCRSLFSAEKSEDKTAKKPSGKDTYPIWADGHVIDLGKRVVFSAFHQLINGPSVLVSADKNTGEVLWVVHHPTKIDGHFLAVEGTLVAIAEDRQMLVVRGADGKSVSLSPLRNVLKEGQIGSRPRGEFAGVFLDEGELFILGADERSCGVYPFATVKGTLEWPMAHLPGESIPDKPEKPQIPKRATVVAIGRHYRKQLDWLVKCARNYDDYQDRFNRGNLLDEKEMRRLFANAAIVGAAVYSSNSGNKTGLDVKSGWPPVGRSLFGAPGADHR